MPAKDATKKGTRASPRPPRAHRSRLAGIPASEQPAWPPRPADDRVSVVVPVLNESERIASVVRLAVRHPRVGEVIVVDDGSIDGTPELARKAGARVITSRLLGKGESMAE